MEIDEAALQYAIAEKKIHSLLGLSQRGGHMASGEFMTEKAVKEGKASLCIVAEDSSGNTKNMFENMCKYYHVPFCCFSDKDTLGRCIGKEFRASLAVLDAGIAKAVIEHFATLGIKVKG